MKRFLNGLGALALSGTVLLSFALTGAALLGFTLPAAAADLPNAIKIGSEGELKFGLLLQSWYVADDSPFAIPTDTTTSSTLGNLVGANTFRLRRAEIKLNGKITSAWGFEVMLDPAKTITTGSATADGKILQDLAVTFLGFKGHELALGQKKIILTEEGIRSSSELDFAERAQITRAVSDRRETGFFYKGDVAEPVTLWASITNGVASNVLDDSNDTVVYSGRFDLKFLPGLNVGASGSSSGGETAGHLSRQRIGAHARYGGVAGATPLILEAEYVAAKDGRASANDLRRDGWYAQALYTFDKMFQIGVRYDTITRDLDAHNGENGIAQADAKTKTFTAGLHWLVQGKNLNIKLDYFNVKEDNRKVNGVLSDSYSQLVIAAQAAF